jgi:hypothetical protein
LKVTVELIELTTGMFTTAELFDEVTEDHLIQAEAEWRPIVVEAARRLPPEQRPRHYHWNWTGKEHELHLLANRFYGITCDNSLQGLMKLESVRHVCRIPEQLGKPLAYVDYLEVAPWNIKAIMQPLSRATQYGAVGTRLIEAAVGFSEGEGFQGRIGLHSLPTSERFYVEVCGMTPVARDPTKQNLLWCEFTPDQAARFRKARG